MFTKELTARVVGIKIYTGEKDGRKYEVKYANIMYEDTDNKYVKGNNVASVKYNDRKFTLEEGNYNILLGGEKKEGKYYYEIIGAQRLDK